MNLVLSAMGSLLNASKGTTIIIGIVGALVGIVILVLIMKAIYKYYQKHYEYNILGGSLAMILVGAGVAGFAVFLKTTPILAYICIGIALIMLILVLVRNIKHCGAAGFFAIFWQILFFAAALVMLVLSLLGVRWSDLERDYRYRARRDQRRRERRRAEKGGDDYYDNRNDRGYY